MSTQICVNYRNSDMCSFTSRANPIKPFTLKTNIGDILVSEINYDKELNKKFAKKLTLFFSKIFRRDLNDAEWQNYYNLPRKEKKSFLAYTTKYYREKLLSPNNHDDLTVLKAEDSAGSLKGLCLAYGFDDIPNLAQRILTLDSIAVTKDLRGSGVAGYMIKALINSSKSRFTDMFLSSDNLVVPYYKKFGFIPLSRTNNEEKSVLEYLLKRHPDEYPTQTQCCLTLQPDKYRWYNMALQEISKIEK